MKQLLLTSVIATLCFSMYAQPDPDHALKFYNFDAYKAEINITFSYEFTQTDTEYRKVVVASQTFEHSFMTGSGQMTPSDTFQVERGDESDGAPQEGDLSGQLDMEAISEAVENSGVDPSVLEMLSESKGELEDYNMNFNKYKMWMTNPASGSAESRIASEYSEDVSGTMHCGEGQGTGTFSYKTTYGGKEETNAGTNARTNPNSFVLQLNLVNNSYSFSTSVQLPNGAKFSGTEQRLDCGVATEKAIERIARSFITVEAMNEGIIYKNALPESGMTLSGSKNITDSFSLNPPLDRDGNWTAEIKWKIYPAGR